MLLILTERPDVRVVVILMTRTGITTMTDLTEHACRCGHQRRSPNSYSEYWFPNYLIYKLYDPPEQNGIKPGLRLDCK
jgi:hypothetical protein